MPVTLVVVVLVTVLIAAIAIPNLLRSRIAANEASAVGSIRTINTAVATYSAQHPGEGYPQKLADLAPYVDENLASGQRSGYSFRYEPQAPDFDGVVKGFRVEARPVAAGQTGTRQFSSNQSGVISYRASGQQPEVPLDGTSPQPERQPARQSRKTERKGSVSLVVAEPVPAEEEVRAVAYRLDGYVESMRFSDEGAGAREASIAIRVPADRFDEARRQVRALGERVKNEQDDARDVTAQYVDLQSNLRNDRAEEAQYLEIMRRSGSIKDTLAVSERLADVRGRIERTQGQLNLLAHQTEMAVLEVTLCTEAVAQPVDVRWHPKAEIKAAFWDAADDLSAYANFMIALFFRLPVFALWVITALAFALGGWRLLRWMWKRLFPASPLGRVGLECPTLGAHGQG
ncbi:MAG TPA: DUF4349 domain-containing protein [Terriglobales bacterium]|nr:DUF4349 domain-containing protein [Terriglobales bacterium]